MGKKNRTILRRWKLFLWKIIRNSRERSKTQHTKEENYSKRKVALKKNMDKMD